MGREDQLNLPHLGGHRKDALPTRPGRLAEHSGQVALLVVGCTGARREIKGGARNRPRPWAGRHSPWLHFSHLTRRFSGLEASERQTQQEGSSPGMAAVEGWGHSGVSGPQIPRLPPQDGRLLPAPRPPGKAGPCGMAGPGGLRRGSSTNLG